MVPWLTLGLHLAVAALKSRRNLALENLALRHQLLVLSRGSNRLRLTPETPPVAIDSRSGHSPLPSHSVSDGVLANDRPTWEQFLEKHDRNRAGGDKPEILHQADFHERIHASPAIAGDNFYLRTASALYAFGK